MNVRTLAAHFIAFPLYDRFHGSNHVRLRQHLRESQYFSEEQVRNNQWLDLKRILRYVYEHNGFYRNRFERIGATPDDFKSPSDFARFPLLSKDDIRGNLDDLVSDEFRKSDLLWRRTGGSTGVPLQLYWDKKSLKLKQELSLRGNHWAHFRREDRYALLWGNIKRPKGLTRRVFNAITGPICLDTLQMDEHNTTVFIERIKEVDARVLYGHGHSIYFLAQFVRDRNITGLKFDGIISTSEMLPPGERRVVEETFGNAVFDCYSCEEVGHIAQECEQHDGLHVAAEGVYLEILDGSEREPGRVVLTDLTNHGTPLIRYEIGDLATTRSGACSCGRGLPRIGRIIGRTSDILYTPEGKRISGISILDTWIIHIRGFKQVQIVQEKLDEITFNIVKDKDFTEESLKSIDESFTKYFGPSMKYKIVFVDKIPLTGRGKFQFTICSLNQSAN